MSRISTQVGMGPPETTTDWKPLRIGAGGWLTGIDIAPDGTMVVRADTYGAYIWNAGTSQWDQLVTATKVGETSYKFRDTFAGIGVFEIAIAPSDSSRIYMVWDGYVYRSDDKGASFTKTNFSRLGYPYLDPNLAPWKQSGQKMAVDPNDPDTVYLGTASDNVAAASVGVWYTHNAGSSWTQIPTGTIPFGNAAGHAGIAFDPTSGTDGNGYTNTIMVPSYGNGVWRTTNAGSTWSQTSGAPTTVWKGLYQPGTGVYWCCLLDSSSIWKYASGSWTAVDTGRSQIQAITFNKDDATHIMCFNEGGIMAGSFNNGSTWNPNYWAPYARTATDIPWLAWTAESWMSNGNVMTNPVDGKLYFSQGIGVWKTTFPTVLEQNVTWDSQSKGIEQLVTNWIWSVPGGNTFLCVWDRGVFKTSDPDVFPSTHIPSNVFSYGGSVEHATNDSTFVVCSDFWQSCGNISAYSTNGGTSWTAFATTPSGWTDNIGGGGHIAVSTDQNMVWARNRNFVSYYTTNRGATWSECPSPANVSTDWTTYGNRHIVTADRVTPNKFYLYVARTSPAVSSLYVSTNGGAGWSEVYSGHIISTGDGYSAMLKSVPGKANHLFFANGPFGGGDHVGPDQYETFKRSINGGADWSTVSNVLEVYDFGFGKEKPGGSYPTIFIAGFVNSVFGVWMSDDECSTWTRLGDTPFPLGWIDNIKCVGGDMNIYGRCYVGFQGSGFAYYDAG